MMSKSRMMCVFLLDECCQVDVVDEVVIKVVVGESQKLNDEGRHCEDDLVNEHVKVEI